MKKQSGKSVLCIGSDLINLNLRCSLLRKHGWAVESSGSGHDGVLRFSKGEFQAVVLDLNDDGAESALIAAELKRQNPGICIIMLITSTERLAPRATEQADAVILKSQEETVLPDRLRSLLLRM
jgi:CheY-like chemotaxis protein